MNTPGVLRSVPTGKGGGPDHRHRGALPAAATAAPGAGSTTGTRPIVHRFLATFGVPPEEREDACQEVFVAVYRSLAQFRGEARLSTWIYRIAARHAARIGPPPPRADAAVDAARARAAAAARARPVRAQRAPAHARRAGRASCRPRSGWCWCCSRSKGCRSRRSPRSPSCPENTAWSRLHYARAELMAMARKRLKRKRSEEGRARDREGNA